MEQGNAENNRRAQDVATQKYAVVDLFFERYDGQNLSSANGVQLCLLHLLAPA
jgi:hypothetical protein